MKWEYKLIQPTSFYFEYSATDYAAVEEQLNELGAEGWELVSVMPNPRYEPYTRGGDNTYGALIFKRHVTEVK
jgi:hypothetical protein